MPPLDPVEDMKIKSKDFEKTVRKVEILEQRLFGHPIGAAADLAELMDLCVKKEKVECLSKL